MRSKQANRVPGAESHLRHKRRELSAALWRHYPRPRPCCLLCFFVKTHPPAWRRIRSCKIRVAAPHHGHLTVQRPDRPQVV